MTDGITIRLLRTGGLTTELTVCASACKESPGPSPLSPKQTELAGAFSLCGCANEIRRLLEIRSLEVSQG